MRASSAAAAVTPVAAPCDALGPSVEHVSCALAGLRRDGLVSLQKGWVELMNRKGLEEMSGWTPQSPASGIASRTMTS
jgi:hypothetical protein